VSLNHRRPRDPGYDRRLVVPDDPPSEQLLRMYGALEVVLTRGALPPEQRPLCSMGELHLLLSPRGTLGPEPGIVAREPVICWKRGVAEGDFAGIDDAVCTSAFWVDDGPRASQGAIRFSRRGLGGGGGPEDAAEEPELLLEAPRRLGEALHLMGLPRLRSLSRPTLPRIRVALLDTSFSGLMSLEIASRLPPQAAAVQPGLEYPLPAHPPIQSSLGHGAAMAAVLLHALGTAEFEFRFFRLAHDDQAIGNRDRGWLDATALTVALARAAGEWGADVVAIPLSEGSWGTPGHLRAVLREAWRGGRGGKGTIILCSVGSPDSNNDAADAGASCALGADDLASQPWVMAVAASDEAARWYRRYLRVEGSTFPVNRFGPAVAFSAPGAVYLLDEVGGVDDSSLATMLGAAAAAWVLRFNPELSAAEVRELLQRTCDIPSVVDDGPGLAAERFNHWDRMSHGFKTGAGRVNALAAALAAADPICHALLMTRFVPGRIPTPGVADSDPAMLRALAWFEWTSGAEAPSGIQEHALWRGYRALRGQLSRLLLHSLALQEAMAWLARHLMTLWTAETEPSRTGAADHRALLYRLQDTLRLLEWELKGLEDPAPLRSWFRELQEVIEDTPSFRAALRGFLFGKAGGPWGTPIH
jgi:hypothetical protein